MEHDIKKGKYIANSTPTFLDKPKLHAKYKSIYGAYITR